MTELSQPLGSLNLNEGIPAYNRDVAVRCLTRLYETFARMGYFPESEIQYPPAGGWDASQIDAKSLRIMGRNETAIELLQHLPYLKHEYELLYETKPIEYLGYKWSDDLTEKVAGYRARGSMLDLCPYMPFDMELDPGMVALTWGRDGVLWLIDTDKGCIYPLGSHFDVEMTQEDPPWLWYHPVAIEEYFNRLHRHFLALEYIPMPAAVYQRKQGPPDDLEPTIFGMNEEEVVGVRQIFLDHGWPKFDIFQREDCIKAANKARAKAVGKRAIRWREGDVIHAGTDEEEMQKAQRDLKRAQDEYAHEWE